MYHPVKIAPLSNPQINKLLSGQGVRVKLGNAHTIHLSSEQHKKLHKAHEKGKAVTIVLDPYQVHGHAHLKGQGLKDIVHKAVHYGKKHLLPVAKKFLKDEAHKLRGPAEKLVEKTLTPYFGEPLAHDLAMRGTDQGFKQFDKTVGSGLRRKRVGRPRKTGGSLKSIGRQFRHVGRVLQPALKQVGRVVKPYARQALHDLVSVGTPLALGAVGSLVGNPELAMMSPVIENGLNSGIDKAGHKYGFGVHRKRRVGRPRVGRPRGGALMPAGY